MQMQGYSEIHSVAARPMEVVKSLIKNKLKSQLVEGDLVT